MSHGYKCDSCGVFVSLGRWGSLCHTELDGGPVEVVKVYNPQLQSDEGQGVESYTLCDDCRTQVINLVESTNNE